MKLGTKNVTGLKLGAANISRAYLGSALVWEAGGGGGSDLQVVGSSAVKSVLGFTVDVPTGTQDGDLMIAVVARRANSTAPDLATQGWTLVDSETSGNTRTWMYTRTASNEPASYSIASGGHAGAAIVTLRAATIDAFERQSGSVSSANYVAPSVEATTAPGILVCFWVAADGTQSSDLTPPGTMTVLDQVGDSQVRIATAWEAFGASGELGTRTATGAFISADRTGISVAVVAA